MKSIKSFVQILENYKDISYILPIILSILFAITQILSYYFRIGYLLYFNISKEFYAFNLFNDLTPVILSFFINSIILIIVFIVSSEMSSFFKVIFSESLDDIDFNLKKLTKINYLISSLSLLFKNIKRNFKDNYTFKDVLIILIGSYIIIFMSLGYFSFVMYGNLYNIVSNSNFLFFISSIISLIYTLAFKIKHINGKTIKKQNDKIYVEYLLELIFFLLILLIYFQNLGISAARGQREFNIIDNKYVLLYNSNNKYLVADFKYVDPNNLIINTKNIKIIDINNHIVEKRVFNNVIRE